MKADFNRKKLLLTIFVAALVVIIDQITKHIAYHSLTYGNSRPFIDHIWRWTLTLNPNSVWGVSFGRHFPYSVMVILLSLVVILLIIFEQKVVYYTAYAMILGGAIGNLIDRMVHGAVIDFIDWGIPHGPRWPIFNFADSSITVGVSILVILSIVEAFRGTKSNSKEVKENDN